MFSFLALAYGFLTIFVMTSLERNRREEVVDGPVLLLASHSLMGASGAGAALMVGFAAWSNFIH